MRKNNFKIIALSMLMFGAVSCSDEPAQPSASNEDGKVKMQFSFNHPEGTKATETAFEKNDMVGVFVSETLKPLEIAGNVVNNEKLTFDGSSWSSKRPLYWDEGEFNVFAYYPYLDEIKSITDLDFAVKSDQRDSNESGISAYEASDFLFASAKKITATSNPVNLQFSHIMSKLTVKLIKGEEYDGEIPEKAEVTIHNTVTKATIDLAAGVATRNMYADKEIIRAKQTSPTSYTAIIVPQRIDNIEPLIEVTMEGVSYLFESRFVFKPGKHHIVNLVIDSSPEKVKIEIGGEINNWN